MGLKKQFLAWDVYDHHERLLALSSSCVSSPHRRPPQNRRLSPCSTSCHRSQPPSLPVLLPNGSARGDDSGCVTSPSSWSFLSFVIMVLATILLPVTTLSCHFASFICSLACHISSFCLRHSHLRPFPAPASCTRVHRSINFPMVHC